MTKNQSFQFGGLLILIAVLLGALLFLWNGEEPKKVYDSPPAEITPTPSSTPIAYCNDKDGYPIPCKR